MVLVPEEFFDRFKEKKLKPEKSVKIINRGNIDPRDQAKLLIQQQLSFKKKQESRRARVLPIPFTEPDETPLLTSPRKSTPRKSLDRVSVETTLEEIIAPNHHRRAILLTRWLKKKPDIIQWDSTGRLRLFGKPYHDINFFDMMKIVCTPKKMYHPVKAQKNL